MSWSSGPHHRFTGNGDSSAIRTAARSAGDQSSIGPSGVADQSTARHRRAISDSPTNGDVTVDSGSLFIARTEIYLIPGGTNRAEPVERPRASFELIYKTVNDTIAEWPSCPA